MRSLFLVISLSVLACPALAADAPRKKPNVLCIISDDLKPLLGCYGTSWIQSPNIDRLAAKGTVFTTNYCQVAFCARHGSVCSPVCDQTPLACTSIRIGRRTCSAPFCPMW
jgi:iduronate 2-sulfatase